jgi:hypothetical protein
MVEGGDKSGGKEKKVEREERKGKVERERE